MRWYKKSTGISGDLWYLNRTGPWQLSPMVWVSKYYFSLCLALCMWLEGEDRRRSGDVLGWRDYQSIQLLQLQGVLQSLKPSRKELTFQRDSLQGEHTATACGVSFSVVIPLLNLDCCYLFVFLSALQFLAWIWTLLCSHHTTAEWKCHPCIKEFTVDEPEVCTYQPLPPEDCPLG